MNLRLLLNGASQNGNIEMYSDKEIVVDGCKCVEDYNKDYIKLNLGEKNIKICGENLIIDSFLYEQADIKGQIVSLEFTTD